MKKIVLSCIVAQALAGCTQTRKSEIDFTGLSSFKVEITSGATGTKESPLPFSTGGASYGLRITPIDGNGLPMTAWTGPVVVTSEPGVISGPAVNVNGQTTATLTLSRAFGPTRIWVEDPVTFATGVSDAIWYRGPTLADVQTSTNTVSSPFEGERVPIDENSTLVVTALARDGFYVTDTGVAGGQFASIFAFTFGAPGGLSAGDRITSLTGRIGEFLGFTELNNPTWVVVGPGTMPAPSPVTCTELDVPNPNLTMEGVEAGLIEVANATVEVCPSYPNCPDYDEYRQWTLSLGGACSINVVSRYTLSGFDPVANVNKPMTRMVGTLRHIQFADPEWILEPRYASDACCPTCTPALNQGC